MAVTDELMNDMVAEDQPLVPRVDKHVNQKEVGRTTRGRIVPRVDKHVGQKRAGMGPDNLPVFKSEGDAALFLEAAGYVSPPAEMLRGAMMMKQGDIGWGLATIGFGAVGGGTIKAVGKGSLRAIKSLGSMFRKSPKVLDDIVIKSGGTKSAKTMHGGHMQAKERLTQRVSDASKGMDEAHTIQKQQNQALLAQRRVARTNEARAAKGELGRRVDVHSRNMDQDHVEGLIHAENVKATRAAKRASDQTRVGVRPSERTIAKRTGEMKSAIYKAEEFFQRTKLDPKMEAEFVRQAKMGHRSPVSNSKDIQKRAADFRRNWLLDDAVQKEALTGREAEIYRSIGFPTYHPPSSGYEIFGELQPQKAIKQIRNEVRQSLHAEDLSKAGLGVEITPKGVKATGVSHPIDLLPK